MQEKIDFNIIELAKIEVDTIKKIPTKQEPNPSLIDKNKITGFKLAEIYNVADLIRFFPKKYIERDRITLIENITNISPGEEITIMGVIDDISVFTTRTGLRITTFKVKDESATISSKWFGPQYVERRFKKDDSVFLTGKFEIKKNGSIEMKNPYIEINEYDFNRENISFIPIYPKVRNNSPLWIRKKLKEIFDKTNNLDPMPVGLRDKYQLIDLKSAYEKIHFPTDKNESMEARRRLVIDEFMYLQAFFFESKELNKSNSSGIQHIFDNQNFNLYKDNLGFKLTKSQSIAIDDITKDMGSTIPMKRLLQGDVGSGKTVVATYSLLSAVLNGHQSALMAPTEVLANQHYKTIRELCKPFNIEVYLITSTKKNKANIQKKIKSGVPAIYIGTHTLIQEKIQFHSLSFVVIDEQHRFGVEQRSKLSLAASKGTPDILFMTATPIPRTTALTVYGDMDITLMNDLPEGRPGVSTILYDGMKSSTNKIYDKVLEHIEKKLQVFVVCPFIDESEKLDIKAAESVYYEYKQEFNDNVVEILHGRMNSDEKDLIMERMKEGSIDILISTIVIEVGIDIPNASLMVIESAERFGLSQIHQLRGRVGRGSVKSECILHLSSRKKIETITDEGRKRIEAAISTSDGFLIADYDFQIRGEGTVLGDKQSGSTEMKIANLRTDFDLLLIAQEIFYDKKSTAKFKATLLEEAKLFLPHFSKLLLG